MSGDGLGLFPRNVVTRSRRKNLRRAAILRLAERRRDPAAPPLPAVADVTNPPVPKPRRRRSP